MRAYCDFYEVAPSDEALLGLSRALIADPEREGLQIIAEETGVGPVGFATIFWLWSTTRGGRLGLMNDLYVVPEARGTGLADKLIAACAEECRARGVMSLEWQTAPGNARAQAVYDRTGAQRSSWLTYELEVAPTA